MSSGRYPNPYGNRYPTVNPPVPPNGVARQPVTGLPQGQHPIQGAPPSSAQFPSPPYSHLENVPSSLSLPNPSVPLINNQEPHFKPQVQSQSASTNYPSTSFPPPQHHAASSNVQHMHPAAKNLSLQSTAFTSQYETRVPQQPYPHSVSGVKHSGGQPITENLRPIPTMAAPRPAPNLRPPMRTKVESTGNEAVRVRPAQPVGATTSTVNTDVNAAAAGMQRMNIGGRPVATGYAQAPVDPQMQGSHSGITGVLPETVKCISTSDAAMAPRPKMDAKSGMRRVLLGDEVPEVTNTVDDVMSSYLGASPGQKDVRVPTACSEDLLVPVSKNVVRLTVGSFPSSAALARKYALPLGAVIQPLAKPLPGEKPVPVINFGSTTGIVRCRRCRTYINFACSFLNGGRRWACSICRFIDDVSPDYYGPVDVDGKRQDAAQRPELTHGTVEFVAPSEYMIRPPMPAVFIFVLEVTPAAVMTGALANMIAGIRRAIADFSGDGREKVALITFDSTVHFHALRDGPDGDSSVIIVSDIEEMFLPTPDRLLVPLVECRAALERVLDLLPKMYAPELAKVPPGNARTNPLQYISSASCLGAAVEGAYKVAEHWGGKVILLVASRPTVGPGLLRDRGDVAALGTDRELGILRPERDWYRNKGVACTKVQLSCDIFLATPPPGLFMDVGTLAQLAKYTGGHFFYALSFNAGTDGPRLQTSVYRNITRESGLEAVMRIRVTRGLRCSKFSGRFFLRSSDLMALPSCDEDKSYGVQFAFDESEIEKGPFCMQVALLYTTTSGERRIRVHTVAIPVSNSPLPVFDYTDAAASAHLLMRQAAEAVKNRRLEEIKKTITDKLVNSLAYYKKVCATQHRSAATAGQGNLLLPDSLTLMPLYMNGILKNRLMSRDASAAFSMRFDEVSALIHEADIMNVSTTCAFLYPNVFPIYPMHQKSDQNDNSLPNAIPPSKMFLKNDNGVLIDDGTTLLLWVGAAIYGRFVEELMGSAKLGSLRIQDLEARLTSSRVEKSPQIACISRAIGAIRARRGMDIPVRIVLAGSKMQAMIEALMLEDRSTTNMGFIELLRELQRQVSTRNIK